MKFAKIVFWVAGIWGVLVLAPLYFLYGAIGREAPPPITHAQYFYGFVTLAMVWQFVFFVIATDPVRFRPMIGLSVLEKFGFLATLAVLALQGRLRVVEWTTGLPDAVWLALFLVAFLKTRPGYRQG